MKNLLLILFLSLQTFALGNTVASTEGNTIQEPLASQSVSTPVQAYDTAGEKVWECALDIYGKAMTVEGEQGFVPFRYQGQYEDVETGLCYNRFRYYSAESGTYISQDPIGLHGENANFYAYVKDSNIWVDLFGLTGTYIFTDGTSSYIGKGPEGRMGTSMKTQIGGKDLATKSAHMDFNDGVRTKLEANQMGLMVEHKLMSEDYYDAKSSADFKNKINSPGKKLYENADAKIQAEVDKHAADLNKKFKGCH